MKRVLSLLLCTALIFSCFPAIIGGADSVLEIFDDSGAQVTEKIYLQEYRSKQLQALTPVTAEDGTVSGTAIDTSMGNYITWKSNLPLLADVDDSGKVTAYDFSKRAIIQLWIDENIRTIPLVGESTANAIWDAIDSSGIDVDNTDTDTLVAIVSAVAGSSIGESLRTYLDNMNVVITATVYDSEGKALGSDSVEFVIEKSVIASVAPTGVHITNKKVVPTTVAVGAQVQLYGACTPVRLGQGIKWSVGSSAFDTNSKKYAQVSETGLVTFTAPGSATVRVNPESAAYATFSDTVTFTVLDPSLLPVESFDITGETSVGEGKTIQLSVDNVTPAGAYRGDLVWSSADPTIAVVDESGVVTGLDGGSGLTYSKTVVITATMGGVSKDIQIKVTRPLSATISSIEISGNNSLGIGDTETYVATVFPERLNNSSGVSREWGIVDAVTGEYIAATPDTPAQNDTASVSSDGSVTAIGAGVLTIYCKASYNSSSAIATYQIVCGKAITDFSISGTTTLKECGTVQLGISVIAPEDYEPELLKTVVWTIDDDSVASISESGVILGRDAGGRSTSSKRTATVTATVSGVSKSVTITVTGQGLVAINKYSDAKIDGNDCVIVDLPRSYELITYPSRIDRTAIYWAIETDEGGSPWSVSQTYDGSNRNIENQNASINDSGIVSGKKAGKTTIYSYAKNVLSTYIETNREIDIIEIIPTSITLKEPAKTRYLEGDTELDLSGMEVYLNYSKEEVAKYYPDAADYTDAQLSAQVFDYTVSEVNFTAYDVQQYVIVSVTRADKTMNAVFPVTVESKCVESITVSPSDEIVIMEDEELDLSNLKVTANYTNAPSEEVTDYEIDYTSFDTELCDVWQNIRISYSHEGREAEAFIPLIIYGYPVISVKCNGTLNGWNSGQVVFDLSSTHAVDGVSYMYRYENSSSWIYVAEDQCAFRGNQDSVVYFKAINGVGIESKPSEPYHIRIDTVTPVFTLEKQNEKVTNQDYDILLNISKIGASGVASVIVNGEEIGAENLSFTVSHNGDYHVKLTAANGLYCEQTITVDNIDKEAPGITDISLSQEDADAPHREEETEFGLYFSSNVLATVTAEDSGVAGIDYLKYRLVDFMYEPVSDWVTVEEGQTGICDTQFIGYFEFVAVDKAGNESSSVYSNGFVRDSVKPVVTAVNPTYGGKEYTSSIWADDIVVFEPNADAFSGVFEIQYNVDGGEWQTLSGTTLEARDNGTHKYGFRAISYSGLTSDVYEFIVKIDRTVPLIRVDFDGTFGRWTNEAVTFTLGTLNECPSGCTYYFDCGDGWVELGSNIAKITESTNAYYRFKAINGAGLESAPSDSYLVMIDNVKPDAQIIYGQTGKTDAPYDIVIVPLTGEAGTLQVYFDGVDITDTLTYTVKENGRYMLTIIGNNLLSSSIPVEITNFNAIPTVEFEYERIDEDNIRIIGYHSSARNVTVPFEIDGYTVKEIGAGVFANDNTLETVTVASTVEAIGEGAFENCANLKKVTLYQGVTEIGDKAFSGSDNAVIYCYGESAAQRFAEDNGIEYVLLDIVPVGKTIINEEASVIFTQQKGKKTVSQIIEAEGYNVVAVPSFMADESNQFLGTGSVLYMFKNGKLDKTYTIVLFGDLNGDSAVDVLDCSLAQTAHTGKITLEDVFLMAGDIDNSGEVEVGDYQQVINLVFK